MASSAGNSIDAPFNHRDGLIVAPAECAVMLGLVTRCVNQRTNADQAECPKSDCG